MIVVPLLQVAHARSGDKGDSLNIAIFCRKPEYMDHLRNMLTPERIAAHFEGTVFGEVQRYEAADVSAFNFVLKEALGGGGMASLTDSVRSRWRCLYRPHGWTPSSDLSLSEMSACHA